MNLAYSVTQSELMDMLNACTREVQKAFTA